VRVRALQVRKYTRKALYRLARELGGPSGQSIRGGRGYRPGRELGRLNGRAGAL